LHTKKYTEYSRVVVALTAIGKNPENVAGYNLLLPLADYKKTIWQGINGPVWALIALDCGNYEMPQNSDAEVQATREMYIERILSQRLPDGGWALSGNSSDPDITGMALQALSKYKDREDVKTAIEEALSCMSAKQKPDGGFENFGALNVESCVQMIVALCELGLSPEDERFQKDGNTLVSNLLTYYEKGKGFRHTHKGGGSDLMACEQGFYALVALKRFYEGKPSLYNMTDAISVPEREVKEFEGRNPDISKCSIINPGKTFGDISGHENQPAIETLSGRGIINGKSDNLFYPDGTVTRAEFAAIVVRSLSLPEKSGADFKDVNESDWFYSAVNTASHYGIIKGVSESEFNPYGTITREEAAVMTERAAKLCGIKTEIETFEVRNILAEFFDYVKASAWAQNSLAFCYREKILSNAVMEIKPKEAVLRGEIAQIICNMLGRAELL